MATITSGRERRGLIVVVTPGHVRMLAGLIRLSTGNEDLEDLWRDLDAALKRS
jgi:hypothetical protein